MDQNSVTGIILAGGKSLRMGQEKGLVELNAKPLIHYAIEAFQPLCQHILISTNSDAYAYLSFPKIKDKFPDSGPMGGIFSCLAESITERNLVLSCDMPFINTAFLEVLLQSSKENDIVVPWHEENHYEPMCAYYHKNMAKVFQKFILNNNFKIPDAFQVSKTLKFVLDKKAAYFSKDLFYNVNSKHDLLFLQNKQQ